MLHIYTRLLARLFRQPSSKKYSFYLAEESLGLHSSLLILWEVFHPSSQCMDCIHFRCIVCKSIWQKFTKGDSDVNLQSSILHYGSISLITEPSRSTHLEAMRIAKEAGALLSYDPNLRLPLWTSAAAAKESIKSIWDQADIIKVFTFDHFAFCFLVL